MAETEWRTELGARITECLGRFGVAGRVEVEGHLVWLIGHGPTVEVALAESDVLKASQGSAELKLLSERLARELSTARHVSAGQSTTSSNWIEWSKLVPPVALAAVGIWAAVHYLLPHHAIAPNPNTKGGASKRALQVQNSPNIEKLNLDFQSCSKIVSRIQQGGSVTPLDIDGWVVELSLISDEPDLSPSSTQLDEYFAHRAGGVERTHYSTDTPILSHVDAAQSGVLISREPLAAAIPKGQSGILVTWRGQYVAAYFQEHERSEYLRTADSLFNDAHARYGALYARCAQGTARYLGSWYRGPDVGGALLMLLAEMELFADVPQIPDVKPGDEPTAWKTPLTRLADAVRPVTRRRATFHLASTGGAVSERPGEYATVQFPFSVGNRANIASSGIAHKVWPRATGPF